MARKNSMARKIGMARRFSHGFSLARRFSLDTAVLPTEFSTAVLAVAALLPGGIIRRSTAVSRIL